MDKLDKDNFSRGDRRLIDVLERAYKLGCKFDGWSERFDMTKWRQAFDECGVDMSDYTREWKEDEVLPWPLTKYSQ